jgi:hypothetical protein
MLKRIIDKVFNANFGTLTYWNSLLRFGIPWTVLYRGTDYLYFRMEGHNNGSYPWAFYLAVVDPVAMLTVSVVFWGLVREIASRKRRSNQQQQGN